MRRKFRRHDDVVEAVIADARVRAYGDDTNGIAMQVPHVQRSEAVLEIVHIIARARAEALAAGHEAACAAVLRELRKSAR